MANESTNIGVSKTDEDTIINCINNNEDNITSKQNCTTEKNRNPLKRIMSATTTIINTTTNTTTNISDDHQNIPIANPSKSKKTHKDALINSINNNEVNITSQNSKIEQNLIKHLITSVNDYDHQHYPIGKPKNTDEDTIINCINNNEDNIISKQNCKTEKNALKRKISSTTTANNDDHQRIPMAKSKKTSEKFIYGNYNRYYGYRNVNTNFKDIRIDAFANHPELFRNKEILDIGCNDGLITISIAREFHPKKITGIDIDRNLIKSAQENKKRFFKSNALPTNNINKFPENIEFQHANYVLATESLLDISEESQFDTILCLSVMKWIHLNWGDDGVCKTFKRIFKQLKTGGHLILELQNWKSYKRRKKLTTEIWQNFLNIKLKPNNFSNYLLSTEIGFSHTYNIELNADATGTDINGNKLKIADGFKRLLQVFIK